MNYHITPSFASRHLKNYPEKKFIGLLKHGTMQLEYFAPFPKDLQQPHSQDELYFIIKGESWFDRNGEVITCKEGDVLFVPAGMPHRFLDMSQDFATWVVLYGPDGGEM